MLLALHNVIRTNPVSTFMQRDGHGRRLGGPMAVEVTKGTAKAAPQADGLALR